MKASNAFKRLPEDPQKVEDLGDEEEQLEAYKKSLKFPWHAKQGIIGCIKRLNVEFNEKRDLKPVKIFMTGPPASGKTYYSDQLAKYYNIPKVNVKQLLDKVWEWVAIEEENLPEEPDPLMVKVRDKVNALRDAEVEKIEEKRAALDEPEEGWPEIDRDSLSVRVPDKLLDLILRNRLAANACRNRGYILDGYPKTYDDACRSFLDRIVKLDEETGEPIEDEDAESMASDDPDYVKRDFTTGYEKTQSIFPSSAIVLTGKDKELMDRVKQHPEERIAGTHYNEADMKRRLATYRTANNSVVAEPSVQEFFKRQCIKVYQEDINTSEKQALNGFKIYIERVSHF